MSNIEMYGICVINLLPLPYFIGFCVALIKISEVHILDAVFVLIILGNY